MIDQPFRMTLHLRTPMVWGRQYHPPTLDALLSAARVRQTGDLSRVLDLPLHCEDGLFSASCPMFHESPLYPLQECTCSYVRGFKTSDAEIDGVVFISTPAEKARRAAVKAKAAAERKARKAQAKAIKEGNPDAPLPPIELSEKHAANLEPRPPFESPFSEIRRNNGPWKGALDHYVALTSRAGGYVLSLVYFACGDPLACENLIRDYLPGVGKRGCRGSGEIDPDALYTTAVAEDCSRVHPVTGRPMRPIPLDRWEAIAAGSTHCDMTQMEAARRNASMLTWQPSYFHTEPALCVAPPLLMRGALQ